MKLDLVSIGSGSWTRDPERADDWLLYGLGAEVMCTFLFWTTVQLFPNSLGEVRFILNVFHLEEAFNYATLDLKDPCGDQNIESFDVLWLFPSPDGKYRLLMRDEKKSLSSLNRSHRVWSRHPTGHHVFRAGHCQRPAGLAVNDC